MMVRPISVIRFGDINNPVFRERKKDNDDTDSNSYSYSSDNIYNQDDRKGFIA